jgi:glyoxylase-like metal-dependent hydrolase (beta-lactamase superfamily II)
MIQRWDLITVGNLSRNRYWGEGDDRPRRAALCTCTLVRGGHWVLLVDPSLDDRGQMHAELNRRSGLSLEDVTHVFVTHGHGDHHAGLRHFEKAQWLAGSGVAGELSACGKYSRGITPLAPGATLLGAITVLPTFGHTQNHCSLRFDCEGLSVVVAGDAAMTRDFFRERRGYFNTVDAAGVARTIDHLAQVAQVIVPGHDNYFLIRQRPIPALA